MNLSDVLSCQSLDQPVIFVLCIQPLCIVNHHSLFHHTFSDCSHLYASAHLSELHEIISSSQACTSNVPSQQTAVKRRSISNYTVVADFCLPLFGFKVDPLDQTLYLSSDTYPVHIRFAVSNWCFLYKVPGEIKRSRGEGWIWTLKLAHSWTSFA